MRMGIDLNQQRQSNICQSDSKVEQKTLQPLRKLKTSLLLMHLSAYKIPESRILNSGEKAI